MNHNIEALGFATSDVATFAAVSGMSGEIDIIAAVPGEVYAVIESVGDYLALTGNLVIAGDPWVGGPVPSPGDTITVVGSTSQIPDYQRGMTLVINKDGVAHFPNAGHFAAAFNA